MNRHADYFSYVGSYDGLVKMGGRWIRVTGLNRIVKAGWIRWQGPPNRAMCAALKMPSVPAVTLFPELRIVCSP